MDMSLRTKEYFITEAFRSIRRNGLMSVASISTVTVSLLVLSLFFIMVLNINNMTKTLETQVQITVYMKDTATKELLAQASDAIAEIPGVTNVTFTDKQQALDEFKVRLGDQKSLLESLGETNPLPNSFKVQVDKPERLRSVSQQIESIDTVEETKFGQETIDPLFKLTNLIRLGGIILITFLSFATLFIISNTIRLTVFARRKEVNIMKYVGATDWFIRWPFIIEGMFLGLIGAFIASILLILIYSFSISQINESLAFLPILPKQPLLSIVTILTIILGMFVGAIGSFISLKKFLKV